MCNISLAVSLNVRRYMSPSNRYWRSSAEHYDGRDRMEYGRYSGREGGRMRFRYPARKFHF